MTDRSDTGIEQSAFDQKVNAIAVVLDEFPPMQVLKAIERLAEDSDSKMEEGDVATIAENISTGGMGEQYVETEVQG